MSDEPLPNGVELTALDEAFRNNPYAVLERVRTAAPVLYDTQLKRYIYTSHDDVKAILHDKDLWSDPRKANPGTFTREFLGQGDEEPSMLLMDEPDHRRLRLLVSRPFLPAAVARWRGQIEDTVTAVLDRIDTDEFDLIARFAGPIPTIVIACMLGIDESRVDAFKQWSDTSVRASFPIITAS